MPSCSGTDESLALFISASFSCNATCNYRDLRLSWSTLTVPRVPYLVGYLILYSVGTLLRGKAHNCYARPCV